MHLRGGDNPHPAVAGWIQPDIRGVRAPKNPGVPLHRTHRALVPALLLLASSTAWAVPDRGMDPATPMKDAETAIPKHRLYYTNATFARLNPLGLIDAFSLGWRYRLMDSDSVLFNDTYTMLGLSARASPAFARVGARAEVNPIAVWKAFGAVEGVYYFGTFDQVTGFADADAVYDDDTLEALGRGRSTLGWVATAGTVLQAKAGPVAVRSTFQGQRYALDLPEGERFFYDQFWDRLAPNEQWMLLNDLDLMGVFDHARIGARWTWSDALIDEGDSVAGLAQHRVGPLFAWQFKDEPAGTRFNKPTVFALAQWWMQHPYRDGTVSSQAMPLIALGFAFQGDLLGAPPTGG